MTREYCQSLTTNMPYFDFWQCQKFTPPFWWYKLKTSWSTWVGISSESTTRKIPPSMNNPNLIMMRTKPYNLSHLQMVLGHLIKLVGRNLMIQTRLLWLEKHILSLCGMKIILVLLLKWEDSHRKNSQKYPWHQNRFGHPSSINQHRSEHLLNDSSQILFSLLVPWTQSHQHYCYFCCHLFRYIFTPLWMLG